MQIAHIRDCLSDRLAIQLDEDAQHSVSGRMRWPHVEDHFVTVEILEIVTRTRAFGRHHMSRPGRSVFKFDGLSRHGLFLGSPDAGFAGR